jgi:hypothetical protein
MSGYYTLSFANGDTGTASNSYNIGQDYGRASFVRRNTVFLMGNYTGPWAITFNPFLIAQAGRHFNITTENDLTGDNFFNNRPSYALSPSDCATAPGPNPTQFVLTTAFGCLDTNPQAGETLLPSQLGNGPAAVAVNLRASRSFGIGPRVQQSAGPSQGGRGGPGGPGGIGGGLGGPGGGGGRGGGGEGGGGGGMMGLGGGRGGMSNTGRKYSLTFSAQALNLFNDIDYGTPSGSVAPTFVPLSSTPGSPGTTGPGRRFGVSTSLAGGIFASPSDSSARRIFFQAAFQF